MFEKIKSIIEHYQTLYVVWGNIILFWCYWLFHDYNIYIFFFLLFSYFVFAGISEITIHRYFTHKSFEVSEKLEKIFLFLATLVGQGSILHWVAVHRQHHAFEDTSKDPHSPLYISKLRIYLGLFPRQNYKLSLVSDLIKSKNKTYFLIEKKYYIPIWTLIWIFSYIINPYLFLFIIGGSFLWFVGTSTVNCFAHQLTGKKIYHNSVGINSSILNLLTGAGNHNNHHGKPSSFSYKVDNEIDVYGSIINLIRTKNTN